MEQLTEKQTMDMKILITFVQMFCRSKHGKAGGTAVVELPVKLRSQFRNDVCLCGECAALVDYALEKLRKCPLDPKPSCKHCRIHCYSKEYRGKIRQVMAFSGKRLILRGRLDLLWHYFCSC